MSSFGSSCSMPQLELLKAHEHNCMGEGRQAGHRSVAQNVLHADHHKWQGEVQTDCYHVLLPGFSPNAKLSEMSCFGSSCIMLRLELLEVDKCHKHSCIIEGRKAGHGLVPHKMLHASFWKLMNAAALLRGGRLDTGLSSTRCFMQNITSGMTRYRQAAIMPHCHGDSSS